MHLEGTAPPDLIRRLAERNGMPVPEGVFDTPERNFAYETPHAADIPEGLASFQAYYAAHPRQR